MKLKTILILLWVTFLVTLLDFGLKAGMTNPGGSTEVFTNANNTFTVNSTNTFNAPTFSSNLTVRGPNISQVNSIFGPLTLVASNGLHETFQNSGQRYKRIETATNYTSRIGDFIIGCRPAGAALTNTLPLISTLAAGKVYVIKDEDLSAGTTNIVIVPTPPDRIDGAANKVMNVNGQAVSIYADGITNWFTW